MALTQVQDGMLGYDGGSFANRNRIINGDMRIDQRNAGGSVAVSTSTPNFITDRFAARHVSNNLTAQQVTDAPSGFVNSLKITVGTGASPTSQNRNGLNQNIEGYNVADLDYGAATAKTVTVSFWVKSSLTGTFGAALRDTGTEAPANYSYVFNYVINTANTWEYKTVTIDGNTSGSWNKTNGLGLSLMFDLGSGSGLETTTNQWASGNYVRSSSNVILGETSGATFYITGVQLEAGSVATPFEHRQYGQELALCQRYFAKFQNDGTGGAVIVATGGQRNTTSVWLYVKHPVTMRSEPTAEIYLTELTDFAIYANAATITNTFAGFDTSTIYCSMAAAGAAYRAAGLQIDDNTSGFLSLSSEL
tara:strand:- start:172 stop:1260 length:1089 start_codon:yes stop_codon:yes gene_type:complete